MTPVDAAADRLGEVGDGARARGDRLGYFAAMYRQVTRAVGAQVAAGAFDDGERMLRFVKCFAGRYLGPVGAWSAGGPVPRCWRVAFDAAGRGGTTVLQHLLLGINAHINLDLAVAAAEIAPGTSIGGLEADFGRVNDVLAAMLGPTRAVLGRFSPRLDVLDRVGGQDDDQLLNFSIRVARHEAWSQAVALASAPAGRRDELVQSLDRRVALLGRVVAHPGGLLQRAVDLVAATESHDVAAVIDALGWVTVPLL